jgi:iron complex transport system ATP-binding protein
VIAATGIGMRFGAHEVLAGVDLSTRPGQVIGLIGPNGSGKSTLLRCMYGMLRPERGAVLVDTESIEAMSRRAVARTIAVVAQDVPGDATAMTVAEFVLLGRHVHRGDHQGFTADDHRIVLDALERVHVAALGGRQLHELSGGERQRVLIARCLAQQCPTMLLDEPTNHLDIRFQHDVLELVRGLELNTIVVLHDLNLANRYCDHVVLLDQGNVVRHGCADEVLCSDVLEPVYGIPVRRLADGLRTHLAFGPT